jgi:hypothetical protein
MLSILYIERRQEPEYGSVGLWQLEKLLGGEAAGVPQLVFEAKGAN